MDENDQNEKKGRESTIPFGTMHHTQLFQRPMLAKYFLNY